jgi:hypothetical protein
MEATSKFSRGTTVYGLSQLAGLYKSKQLAATGFLSDTAIKPEFYSVLLGEVDGKEPLDVKINFAKSRFTAQPGTYVDFSTNNVRSTMLGGISVCLAIGTDESTFSVDLAVLAAIIDQKPIFAKFAAPKRGTTETPTYSRGALQGKKVINLVTSYPMPTDADFNTFVDRIFDFCTKEVQKIGKDAVALI